MDVVNTTNQINNNFKHGYIEKSYDENHKKILLTFKWMFNELLLNSMI